MMVTVYVNESSLGAVVQDLSSARGGQVMSLDGADSGTLSSGTDLPRIDPNLIYTPPDPFATGSGDMGSELADSQRQIVARVPLKEMVGYLNQLRALTGGRGTFVMSVDGFEKMGSRAGRGWDGRCGECCCRAVCMLFRMSYPRFRPALGFQG
jgi:elongation factor G